MTGEGPRHPPSGGKKIRACRGTRTQAEFGRLLGVTRVTIGNWERGTSRPRAEHVKALKRAGCALEPHETSSGPGAPAKRLRKHDRRGGARPGSGRKPTLSRPVRITVWMEAEAVALAQREAKRRGIGVGRVLGEAMKLYLKAREAGALEQVGEEFEE